jgi:hypothetical protein
LKSGLCEPTDATGCTPLRANATFPVPQHLPIR